MCMCLVLVCVCAALTFPKQKKAHSRNFSVFCCRWLWWRLFLSFHSEECEIYARPDGTTTNEAPPSPTVERIAARTTDPKAVPALDKDRRRCIIAGVVSEAREGRD